MKEIIFLWIFGFILPTVSAQILTTKCPTHWMKYKERCYLFPGYRHGWYRALEYCQKYGAKLVQPTGYVINDRISHNVSTAYPDASSFWIGYYQAGFASTNLAVWSDGQETSVEVGVWGQDQPDLAAGQFAFVSTTDSKWYMCDQRVVRHFVCEMDPCPSGNRDTYMCNGKCLSSSVLCNGVNDCGNNQDENDCATDCTFEYEGDSGIVNLPTASNGLYQPNSACTWTIKSSPDKRIVLQFMDFETEENTDHVELWDGGLTGSTSDLAARLSGPLSGHTFISSYNFVTVRFVSDSTTEFTAGSFNWQTADLPSVTSNQIARAFFQQLVTPLYPDPYTGNTEIEYTITATANNLITLEVLYLELCCGDYIYIYDNDREVLETLTKGSTTSIIMSTSNMVRVKMELNRHLKCKGAQIQYKQGCDVTMFGSGTLNSPGYGTANSYPDLMDCSWTLYAPSSDRSVTVVFEDFDLDKDKMVITPASGMVSSYTGTALNGQSRSEETNIRVTMTTGARFSGRGFRASFSPGCPGLEKEGIIVDPSNSNFGAQVSLSCAKGYKFSGEYSQQTSLTLTCEAGGRWSVDDIPPCIQGQCGPAPFIDNGVIKVSTGSVGGSVTEYMCNNNYTLEGSASITCQADDNWEEPPQCVSTPCPNITTLAPTTSPWATLLDGVMHGSVVDLGCDDGDEIIGAKTVQCITGQFDFVSDTDPSYCNPIPCGTPVIANGVLSPNPPYSKGQEISARCVEGHVMKGAPNFTCGGNEPLPSCWIQNCSLDDLDRIVPGDGSGKMEYTYGADVTVTCEDGFYLKGISTSHMVITCLQKGGWGHAPTCGKADCGVPFQVRGSIYSPAPGSDWFCYEHGCSFTFQCREKYDLFGSSSLGNTTVICGETYNGLWDFDDLRCIGGQCPDPGYPPDSELVGLSFEENANITYRCIRDGYELLELSTGQVSQGMTCMYNATSGQMEWVGEESGCIDTMPPTIFNCDDGVRRYEADLLTPLDGAVDPFGIDNNAIENVVHNPLNEWLSQPFEGAAFTFWTFEDFDGNKAYCRVEIVIPAAIGCSNDISARLVLNTDTSVYVPDFVEVKNGRARVVYEPVEFDIPADESSLNTIHESHVTAFNGDSNEILDTCTVQLKFQASACATWAFDIPNGEKDCAGNLCTITCNEGSLFMDDPAATSVTMVCDGVNWDRDPPVCATTTEDYLRYTTSYDYEYFIGDGVSDFTECESKYQPYVQGYLSEYADDMEMACNVFIDHINPVIITLLSERTRLEFSLGTKRLSVTFSYVIGVTDETMSGTTSIKQTCANIIQSDLNTMVVTEPPSSIFYLDSIQNSTIDCGSGRYDGSSTTPVFGYECLGYRRYDPFSRLCLGCPLGFYYDETTEPYDCRKCPSGTYGVISPDGAMCQTCPENKNPGLEGQTDVSSCDFKEACTAGHFSFDGLKPCKECPKGYYSTESYSRTCIACGGDKVTYDIGSTSSIDCKTLDEAIKDSADTPCTPENPCSNGGTCGFVRSDYNCTCPPGYTGRNCETTFNLCTSKPCKNGKECVTTAGSDTFTCLCSTDASPSELTGELCEIDDLGCAPSFCANNGTCHNQFQSHTCKCATYSGYQNEDGTCGALIEPCEVEPLCEHGTCIPNSHFYKTCDCDPGWTGIYCESNINDCDIEYCVNGATCVDDVNNFICACADGFHGPYCQFTKSCDRRCVDEDDDLCHTCSQDYTDDCVNVNDDFMCTCIPGYSGRSCEIETSICKSFPCQHGGTCTPVNSTSFTCDCMDPWTGEECEMQINNCPNGDQCFNGGTCYSTSSGYRCKCPDNYIGDDCSEEYDLCERANPCAAIGSICSFSSGTFSCSCPTGYTGDYCENEILLCSDVVCANGGTCSNTDDGAECACADEYTGPRCETEIDSCLSAPCSSNQECLNSAGRYTCICAVGYRGPDCNKAVGDDFDYVITPVQLCREEASEVIFTNSGEDIDALTISFWARYTSRNGRGVLLNVIGSKSGGTMIPSSPDVQLTFLPTQLETLIGDTTLPRRKRQIQNGIGYGFGVSIDDGIWHHLAVTWGASRGEMTLFVDGVLKGQIIFSYGEPIANVGFLVFGDIDTTTGITDADNSFGGRVSRVFVLNSELSINTINELYTRSYTPTTGLLPAEKTIMLVHSVDHNSELNINVDKCVPADVNCLGLDDAANTPVVDTCPSDTFVVRERGVLLSWTVPVFNDVAPAASVISNYESGDTAFDFGVHGIIYAGFDAQGDATTCSFRVFYNEVGCGEVDGNNADCDVVEPGGKRCTGDCPTGQSLTGSLPVYQTCSMYGMWDEAVKYTSYIYPACAPFTDITQKVALELMAFPSTGTCVEIKESYSTAVLGKFNDLNSQQSNSALCPNTCANLLENAFSCVDDNIKVSIDFGILSSTMMYDGVSVSTEDLLKIAVADFGAFYYIDVSNTTVSPDISTLSLSVTNECVGGSMISAGKCVSCGMGTYYNATSKSCMRCGVGTFRTGSQSDPLSACTACHSSQTTPGDGATNRGYCITNCLAGQYYEIPANPNAAIALGTCRSCAVGYYWGGNSGTIACRPCPVGLLTAGTGSTDISDCVPPDSLTTTTTTTTGPTPAVGASTAAGLSVGVIVAVVLGVIFGLALIILIVCFCCCKEILPCLSKKKQVVSPVAKDGYYAKKYGDVNMQFVSYNLQDVREKKGRPLDRVPFVEPPLSEETGSVKTDISVHVPVFTEKMHGKVKRKSMYMSNGGQTSNVSLPRSGRTPRDPVMTSSPRESHYENIIEGEAYVQPKQKRRRKRHGKDRSSSERRSRRRYEEEADMEPVDRYTGGPLPKSLAPMPHRLVSKPPNEIILRPSSPLDQPRVKVVPSQYEDFIDQSPTRQQDSYRSPRSSRSHDREGSRSRRRPQRFEDEGHERRRQYSGEYYEEEQASFHVHRIEVESDEDLR